MNDADPQQGIQGSGRDSQEATKPDTTKDDRPFVQIPPPLFAERARIAKVRQDLANVDDGDDLQ